MSTCPRCFRPATIPTQRFCGVCGASLSRPQAGGRTPPPLPSPTPIASKAISAGAPKLALLLFILLSLLFLLVTLARW